MTPHLRKIYLIRIIQGYALQLYQYMFLLVRMKRIAIILFSIILKKYYHSLKKDKLAVYLIPMPISNSAT